MEKLLPRDIKLQVFYRLPIQSILDCKLVCKSWLNILKDPCFALQHVLCRIHSGDDYVHDHGFISLAMDVFDNPSRSYSLLYHEYGNNDDENYVGFHKRLIKKVGLPTIRDNNDHDFSEAIDSCNGLICLGYDRNPISICNPITREYLCLPESSSMDSHSHRYVHNGFGVHIGFGYHHSTNQYKVVRIFGGAVKRVQVYTLGGISYGWRDKDDISYEFISKKGIFLANGEIYWLCYNRIIVAFNVADETFREFINLPPSMTSHVLKVLLYKLDGCLCAVEPSLDYDKSEVWLLRKTTGSDVHTWSWSREFSVVASSIPFISPVIIPYIIPLVITKSGGLLFWLVSDYGFLEFYDPKHASMQHIGYSTDRLMIVKAIPHINSLVSLKALVGERPANWKRRKLFPKQGLYSPNIVSQLLQVVMNKLSQTTDPQIISENQGDLQAVLCGVLQEFIQTLGASDDTRVLIIQSLDEIMMLLLKVFGCSSSIIRREAMLSMRALVYATGSEFGKYMPRFYKYLEMGLQNFKENQFFAVSVEVVSNICRALDEKILPFCDGIMSHLLNALSSGVMHPSVTPLIISCFGDIGIAIGEHFEKYLPYAMPMIQLASEICAKMDTDNEKVMNYGNQLRRGIFEAYSGILQGLKNSKSELMLPHAGHLLQAIELVFMDKMREESVSKAAVEAMGDLAHTLGLNVKILLKDRAFCADFLRECLDSDDYKMKELATWTQRMIKHVFVCERPSTKRRKLLPKEGCSSVNIDSHLLPVIMNLERGPAHPAGF